MSVAQAFAGIDANTMIDNALARVRRNAGIRTLAPTTSVRDYLASLGLTGRNAAGMDARPVLEGANDPVSHVPWRSSAVARRHARRERRALRG